MGLILKAQIESDVKGGTMRSMIRGSDYDLTLAPIGSSEATVRGGTCKFK